MHYSLNLYWYVLRLQFKLYFFSSSKMIKELHIYIVSERVQKLWIRVVTKGWVPGSKVPTQSPTIE